MRFKILLMSVALFGATLLSGCGNGSSASNGSPIPPTPTPTPTPTPVAAIAITGISSSTPMALTSLSISTSGINASQPVAVMLSNSAGFSAILTPMRTQSDGTVVVAIPIFIDPTTGKTNNLNASLTIGQGGLTSAPVSLTVQDIPLLSAYQTTSGPVTLGQISRAFYNYQILALGSMMDGLQAMQSLPGNTVDTTVPQANVQHQLTNVIEARNDIDRIITNNALQIGATTLPSGTPTTFNSDSVEIMDRVLAIYLVDIVQPSAAAALAGNSTNAVPVGQEGGSAAAIDVTPILELLEPATSVADLGGAIKDFAHKNATVSDKIVSVESGLVATALFVGVVADLPLLTAGATVAGILVGAHILANEVYHVASEYVKLERDSNDGSDPAQLAQDESDLQASQTSLGLAAVGVALGAASMVTEGIVKLGVEGGSFLLSTSHLFAQDSPSTDQEAAITAAGQIAMPFPSVTQGFGRVEGQVIITNSQGAILSGLAQMVVIDPANNLQFSAMADANGNYGIQVPLGDQFLHYGNLTLEAVDPVSGLVLASQGINLTGLTATSPFHAPAMTGTCNDNDANNPDSDDPDCD